MILNANLPLLPSCWVSQTLDVGYLLRVTPACRCHSLNQIPNDYTGEVRDRFKGLDLVDKVPDELWMEVCDTVQEPGISPSPRKRNAKKKKLSEEVLQIAMKREAKRKGKIYPFECRVPENSKQK